MNDKNIEKYAEELLSQMSLREMLEQLQSYCADNSNKRLGIPHMNVGEACHGVCLDGATSFPQALSMAATWNPELICEMGNAVGKEARAFNVHVVFAPMLGLAQDARWGRVEESFGEDPELVSEIACSYIQGLQGVGDEKYNEKHVMCIAKHFASDGVTAKGINGAPVDISRETLRETHFKPFEAAVKKAGVGGIMPAHHSLNRVPCHANEWLLTQVLRSEWGFDGMVLSDMADIPKVYSFGGDADDRDFHQHRMAQSEVEAAYFAIKAGVDMELGKYNAPFDKRSYGQQLYDGIISGKFKDGEKYVRRAAKNALIAKLRLGLFSAKQSTADASGEYRDIDMSHNEEDGEYWAKAMKKGLSLPGSELLKKADEIADKVDFEAHSKLAEKVAEDAVILLKNDDNLLPLNKNKLKKLAVIGENAVEMRLGGYSSRNPHKYVNIVDGLRDYLGNATEVTYSKGCIIDKNDNEYGTAWENEREKYLEGMDEAVDIAKNSDAVLLVVGGNREVCGENTDVDEIHLTWAQRKLARAVYNAGKPVVMLLINGRPNAIVWESENIPSILQSFYLGQETGNAVAKILFGEVNPSGKLPMAIPRRASHIPVLYSALYWGSPKSYIGSAMPATPLYPFGFGLSYTTFEFSELAIDKAEMKADDSAIVSVKVTNTGAYDGSEVVQLYIRDDFGTLVRPVRELKAFKKIHLSAGQSKTVEFAIGRDELKFYKNGEWIVENGTFTIYVGNDSTCTYNVVLNITD